MKDIPLAVLYAALCACLLGSAFFSMAETAMMAVNRYRLKSRSTAGDRGARLALELLAKTEKLLGVILIGNNLINACSASLATVITFRLLGDNEMALGIATIAVTFAIVVVSEATPKVIAASYPEALAVRISFPLALLLKVFYPAVWFVNLFVSALLKLLRLTSRSDIHPLSVEDLRMLTLEASKFIEKKHHSILMNLFDLQNITVDDVMTPRNQIEAIDLDGGDLVLREQLSTAHHTRLPVYRGKIDNILGIIHTRKVLGLSSQPLNAEVLTPILREPYFIPAGTPLFTQLQHFQENLRRIGLVVDEYGELLGLVTLEDILELIIGEFTTNTPTMAGDSIAGESDGWRVDGAGMLRDLNRKLKLHFPLDGPKTLNGLILEQMQDIPDPGTCLIAGGYRLEVLHTQGRQVKSVKIYFPADHPQGN